MKIERRFTKAGRGPYEGLTFEPRVSEIRNPDGRLVFRQEGVTVPSGWSQIAADILAQKYFRKAGVPVKAKRVEENSVPSWLCRRKRKACARTCAAHPDARHRRCGHRFGRDCVDLGA